jgi:hypothetical protein
MPTRFYFPAEGAGAPTLSPAFDAGWEQTGQATRLNLVRKANLSAASTLANTGTRTVPITTTQDILCNQFVSEPFRRPFLLDAGITFSLVIRVLESAATANVTLACVVKLVDSGGTSRATLFSTFTTGTEFPTTAATRIVSATAITSIQAAPGDCIVVEIGGNAAAPTAATTYTMRQGYSATSDFALTAALTTDLNPWCEFSADLYGTTLNNYQSVKSGDGISVNERIR